MQMMNSETSKLVNEVEAMSLAQLKKVCTHGDVKVINYHKANNIDLVPGWTFQKFSIRDLDSYGQLYTVYTQRPLSYALPGDRKPKGITQALKVLYVIAKIFDEIVDEKGEVDWGVKVPTISQLRDQTQAAIYSITH